MHDISSQILEVCRNPMLSSTQKLLLMMLRLTGEKTKKELAYATGMSKVQIHKHLREMKNKGVIDVIEAKYGDVTFYLYKSKV